MGRNSTPREKKIKKERLIGLQAGSSFSESGQKKDECLFSIEENIKISQQISSKIKVGSPVVFVSNYPDLGSIDIWISGTIIGKYKGTNLRKILECMKKNYTYEGKILLVDRQKNYTIVKIKVEGFKK